MPPPPQLCPTCGMPSQSRDETRCANCGSSFTRVAGAIRQTPRTSGAAGGGASVDFEKTQARSGKGVRPALLFGGIVVFVAFGGVLSVLMPQAPDESSSNDGPAHRADPEFPSREVIPATPEDEALPSTHAPVPEVDAKALERGSLRAGGGALMLGKGSSEALIVTLAVPGQATPRWLAAIRGKTGEIVWRLEASALRGVSSWKTTLRIAANGALIIVGETHLTGIDPKSGALTWTHELKAKPKSTCVTDSALNLAPEGREGLELSSGVPVVVDREKCEPAYSSESDGPNFRFAPAHELLREFRRSGFTHFPFSLQRGLVPTRGFARVLLGKAATGAALGVASSKEMVWHTTLSTGRSVEHLSPPLAAVRRNRVVVAYAGPSGGELRLGCYSVVDGKKHWDQRVGSADDPRGDEELAVSTNGTVFFRSGGGELTAIALEAGKLLWSPETE